MKNNTCTIHKPESKQKPFADKLGWTIDVVAPVKIYRDYWHVKDGGDPKDALGKYIKATGDVLIEMREIEKSKIYYVKTALTNGAVYLETFSGFKKKVNPEQEEEICQYFGHPEIYHIF